MTEFKPKKSLEPDSNQRPKDIYQFNYSPPLYQLSYRGWPAQSELCSVFEINMIQGHRHIATSNTLVPHPLQCKFFKRSFEAGLKIDMVCAIFKMLATLWGHFKIGCSVRNADTNYCWIIFKNSEFNLFRPKILLEVKGLSSSNIIQNALPNLHFTMWKTQKFNSPSPKF